jgi:recombination protein RecT
VSGDATRAALARHGQPDEPNANIAQMINAMRPEIARAIPKGMDPDRLVRIALTIVRKTPELATCSPQSILGALMTCSQLGLEPGPLDLVHLIPRSNECTLLIGYRGYIELAYRSGLVARISAEAVYENDFFVHRKGLTPVLEHSWDTSQPRGKLVAAWCAHELTTGGADFVVIGSEDAARAKQSAQGTSRQSSPWNTDVAAMWRKTAIRRDLQTAPKSPELARALAIDGAVRTELAPEAIDTLTGPDHDISWPEPATPGKPTEAA